MAKRDEGKKYKEELLKLVPEDKRALVAEALGEQAEDHLGEHVMMRSDYSKKLDEVSTAAKKVNAYNAELTNWFEQEQARLAEAARLKEELEALKAGKGGQQQPVTPPDPEDPVSTAALQKMTAGLMSREEGTKILNDALGQQAGNLVSLSVSLARLTGQHLKNFDEVLDPQSVIDYAMKNKKPSVDVAYNEMFKERYDAQAAKAAEEKEKKLEEKIRQKVEDDFRAKNPQVPYLVTTEASLSPILEAMKAKEKPEYGTAAALDEYYRMQRPAGT